MADLENEISDELLGKVQKDLADYIEKNNIPKTQKMILETMGYILMVVTNDHQKTSRMYPEFKRQQEGKTQWERFKWVVIPIISGGVIAFAYQAFVFWFELVPKLSQLP